jgi:hypothetical protein
LLVFASIGWRFFKANFTQFANMVEYLICEQGSAHMYAYVWSVPCMKHFTGWLELCQQQVSAALTHITITNAGYLSYKCRLASVKECYLTYPPEHKSLRNTTAPPNHLVRRNRYTSSRMHDMHASETHILHSCSPCNPQIPSLLPYPIVLELEGGRSRETGVTRRHECRQEETWDTRYGSGCRAADKTRHKTRQLCLSFCAALTAGEP